MPKAYVTNFSNVDYSSLEEKYGAPIMLTTGYVELSHEDSIQKLWDRVRGIIEAASPDDYLVISGNSPVSIVMFHFWMRVHGIVRMLSYNRRINGGTYTETTISRS